MSAHDINQARLRVQENSEKLDHALDKLKFKVIDGSEKVRDITEKASHVANQLKNPTNSLDQIVERKREQAENYVADQTRFIQQTIHETVDSTADYLAGSLNRLLSESKDSIQITLNDLQSIVLDRFKVFSKHSGRFWPMAFLGGLLFGMVFGRKTPVHRPASRFKELSS
jgi:methyl-accepting chemotaxis protein